MPGTRRPSAQAMKVLHVLAAQPAQWRYGYDLATEVHLKSGSLYPILVRLIAAYWRRPGRLAPKADLPATFTD